MADDAQGVSQGGSTLKLVLLVVAVLYVAGSIYWIVDLQGRIAKLETAQQASAKVEQELGRRLGMTQTEMREAAEALASKVGSTQEEINRRTAELKKQQQATDQRLAEQGQQTQQGLQQVAGSVAGVQTEVGTVRGDVAATRTDLEQTKLKLERAIGDLGQQSGLIARTRDELDFLKHKGDRNYFEFTLIKDKRAVPVSTVSLRLKATDAKKGKFSLDVLADDKVIEKKDRTMREPLQFYTGRENQLYELVVMTVDKNKVTGYISTPKTVAQPN